MSMDNIMHKFLSNSKLASSFDHDVAIMTNRYSTCILAAFRVFLSIFAHINSKVQSFLGGEHA